MNEQQYKEFKEEKARLSVVGLADLANKAPRTLLYGYNTDRSTFHVYIDPTDGLIHVLNFVSAGRLNEEKFLVLSHTKGENGGLGESQGYVPNKRLYPESCDLEFCRLLRDADVNLPFTTFDEKGLSRVERHNGFASYIYHPDTMFPAVELRKYVPFDMNEFQEPKIAEQLVRTACFDAGVASATVGYPEVTVVAEGDVDKVKAKIQEYYDSMSPAAKRTVEEIENDITDKTVRWGGYSSPHSHYADRLGAYSIHIQYSDAAEPIYGSDATMYEGPEGERVMQGTYEGRPYFVMLRSRMDSRILVHLFGPSEQFVAEVLKFHKLTRVSPAA